MSLTGALFDAIDDDRVLKLILEKKRVASEDDEGADISVRWIRPRDGSQAG